MKLVTEKSEGLPLLPLVLITSLERTDLLAKSVNLILSYLLRLEDIMQHELEPRQYSVKNNSTFEIAAPFHHLYGQGKRAAISKFELFLTEWSRSYFGFALGKETKIRS